MKRRIATIGVAAALLALAIFVVHRGAPEPIGAGRGTPEETSADEGDGAFQEAAPTVVEDSRSVPPEDRIIPVEQQTPNEQVLATRRMYLAHAPLREEAVDDPDSGPNKRILQAMIANSLSRVGSGGDSAEE